uniref:Uncharacterized protein n=1 Tax=viral metagenome TaxID=1070528 RepID=A0A6M3K117_9ZZZZ
MDSEKAKRLAAFCVLMQHGIGVMGKSPEYILQKYELAMTLPLDLLHQMFYDQGRALNEYFERWKHYFE